MICREEHTLDSYHELAFMGHFDQTTKGEGRTDTVTSSKEETSDEN